MIWYVITEQWAIIGLKSIKHTYWLARKLALSFSTSDMNHIRCAIAVESYKICWFSGKFGRPWEAVLLWLDNRSVWANQEARTPKASQISDSLAHSLPHFVMWSHRSDSLITFSKALIIYSWQIDQMCHKSLTSCLSLNFLLCASAQDRGPFSSYIFDEILLHNEIRNQFKFDNNCPKI